MKQVIRRGLRQIIVDEVPDPVVIPHHVIIRPVYSLISSGTESAGIHQEAILKEVAGNPSHLQKIWNAAKVAGPSGTLREVRAKFSEYAVMGYSGAGIVVDKHPTVSDLVIGDRVAYGGEGTGHGEAILAGRNLVARVPAEVPFEHACFATLGAIAMNAVRIAGIGLGDRVAVIGMGLVGQLIGQLARLQGARLIAIDLRPERLDLARRLGAEQTLMGGDSLRQSVAAATDGRGVDCVIVAAAAKSSAPTRQALDICRDRGRLVIVGAVEINLPWQEMYLKEIQLFMARAYGPGSYDASYEKGGHDYPLSYVRWTENRNMEEFLRLAGPGGIQLQPLITHEYALGDAAKAYDTILDRESGSLAVVLRYPVPAGEAFERRTKIEIPGARSDGAAKSSLGVGLIGAGNLARWEHLPCIQKIPGVQLRAVYSASGARGKSLGIRFGAAYCCSDYDQMLKDPAIDAVFIVSRNQRHAGEALAALETGKHVFVEKPMALTEEECRTLAGAVKRTGRYLSVGFNRRFAPFYLELKRRLAGRSSPAVLNCRINSPGISGAYWMADPAAGGAILGEACHFADLLYWLLESEPVAVTAYSLPTGKADPIGENNLVSTILFADGSIANFTYCTVGSATSGGERVEVFAPGLGMVSEDFKKFTLQAGMRRAKSAWFAEKGDLAQAQNFFDA